MGFPRSNGKQTTADHIMWVMLVAIVILLIVGAFFNPCERGVIPVDNRRFKPDSELK